MNMHDDFKWEPVLHLSAWGPSSHGAISLVAVVMWDHLEEFHTIRFADILNEVR